MGKYIDFAFDAILSFSYKPLKYLGIIGFIVFIISLIMGVRIIFLKLTDAIPEVQGWVSLMVSVLFLGGIQLICISLIGQYIARIYDEVKQRPSFIVNKIVGFEEKNK